MKKTRFGRTGLMVSRTAVGCIPIQRISMDASDVLLRRAFEAGINFFDTARAYTTSEERLGRVFATMRDRVFIASKSGATDPDGLRRDLETSLRNLRTDYIDLYQHHNPSSVAAPGDAVYDTLLEFRRQGRIRYIGVTNHDLGLVLKAIRSGHYDAVQYPLSPLSTDAELALAEACREADVGLLAMKALAGGLITDARVAFAFLRRYENVVPIWGIQRTEELEEFIRYESHPPVEDDAWQARLAHYRKELSGAFCRGCGYCLPCPAEIPIPMAARMSLLLQRSRPDLYTTEEWREKMGRIANCIHCGKCAERCPYHLNPSALVAEEGRKYERFVRTGSFT
ncbi:MAG: aldo/keto reductase [Phycisphaerales bacterium]|nr:aldo/keto reductase [Phycisphaerales bacterium]